MGEQGRNPSVATAASLGARGDAVTPPPPVFAVGDRVASRYLVVRAIARGGMGEVYEVFDSALNISVALKTIRPETAADATGIERFKREINIARRIAHPNVCRVFDLGFHRSSGDEADVLFLTMELLRGETLADRIGLRRLPPEEALALIEAVASGLDAAHDAGVIHRDFKPSNVILVADGRGGVRAVVTDFGLARTLAAGGEEGADAEADGGSGGALVSQAGSLVGTAAYMAPEQVEGGMVSPATDVYALGVVLFEMLTQRRPFGGRTAIAVATRRLTEAPPSPRQHVPEISARWESVILRCLARDPAARFARATEVVAALRGEEPGAAPRDGHRAPLRESALLLTASALALVAAKPIGFFFVPTRAYLAVALGLMLPLALVLIMTVHRGRRRHPWLLRSAAAVVVVGAAIAGLLARPTIEVSEVEGPIDVDADGGPPLENLGAATVRGDTLCRTAEERESPTRRCDTPVPAGGYLRVVVHLRRNLVRAGHVRLAITPPGALAFARVRVDPALGVGSDGRRMETSGGAIDIAGGGAGPPALSGDVELRLVCRQLPGEAPPAPELHVSIVPEGEDKYAVPELATCRSLADGRLGGACDDARVAGVR